MDVTSLRFVFDGQRLSDFEQSIQGMEMEDGDEIDVFVEQVRRCATLSHVVSKFLTSILLRRLGETVGTEA